MIRPLAVAGLASALTLLSAPAFAHVTVNPSTAEQGSYTKLTFRVPDESDTASTTKVQVAFPTDHPITSVRTKAVPGWTAKVETGTGDAVSQVTWTAENAAAAISPGEFAEFDVSVGPLPDTDSVTFKAVQTYSDGTVVRWIESSTDGTEPEHPAPVLTLTAATGDSDAVATSTSTEKETAAASTSDDDSKAPLILSIIALVVAIAGVGLSLARRRA